MREESVFSKRRRSEHWRRFRTLTSPFVLKCASSVSLTLHLLRLVYSGGARFLVAVDTLCNRIRANKGKYIFCYSGARLLVAMQIPQFRILSKTQSG